MLINVKSTGGGGGGERGREEGRKKSCKGGWQKSWHSAIHSVATPQFRVITAAGICYGGPVRGPDSAVTLREIIQTPRSKRRAASRGASARITDEALRRQPCLGHARLWAQHAGFQHVSPLNVILPQWSQHNGCFHTPRDKGRRLRHDTAPLHAEAGILEASKIKGNRQRGQ